MSEQPHILGPGDEEQIFITQEDADIASEKEDALRASEESMRLRKRVVLLRAMSDKFEQELEKSRARNRDLQAEIDRLNEAAPQQD